MSVHFSSIDYDWGTPQNFFDKLNKEFHFTMDVCASEWNAKCSKYFSPEDNGLVQPWAGVCWMNPPYGREIPEWMEKAYEEAMAFGTTIVVCLVPARTDTNWWWNYCIHGEIRFVKGRLKFLAEEGEISSAPFPSAIIVFQRGREKKVIWNEFIQR